MVQQWFTIIITLALALAYSGRDPLGFERLDCQKTYFAKINFAIIYNQSEESEVLEAIEYIQDVLSEGNSFDAFFTSDLMNVNLYGYSDKPQNFICPTNVQCLTKDLIGAYNEVLDRIEYSADVGRVIILVTRKDLTPSVASSLKQVVEAARSFRDVFFNVILLKYNQKWNDTRMLREFDSHNVILVNSTEYLEDMSHVWKKQIWKTAFQHCFNFAKDNVNISVTMSDESIAHDAKAVFNCQAHFKANAETYELLRNGETILPTDEFGHFVVDARDGETVNVTCKAIFPFGLTVTGITRPYAFTANPPKNILPDLADLVMERGSNYDLRCRNGGRLDADFYWTKDGKRLAQKPSDKRFSFKIRNARPSDSGKYICHAINKAGEAQRIINARVVRENSSQIKL